MATPLTRSFWRCLSFLFPHWVLYLWQLVVILRWALLATRSPLCLMNLLGPQTQWYSGILLLHSSLLRPVKPDQLRRFPSCYHISPNWRSSQTTRILNCSYSYIEVFEPLGTFWRPIILPCSSHTLFSWMCLHSRSLIYVFMVGVFCTNLLSWFCFVLFWFAIPICCSPLLLLFVRGCSWIFNTWICFLSWCLYFSNTFKEAAILWNLVFSFFLARIMFLL